MTGRAVVPPDPMRSMRVSVVSPDRHVTACYSPDHGLDVGMLPSVVSRHTESSLAVQLRLVLRGVWHGAMRGGGLVLRHAGLIGSLGSSELTGPEYEEYSDGPEPIWANGPLGCVSVGLCTGGEVAVWLAPGTLNRIDVGVERLATDVEEAFFRAMAALAQWRATQAHRQVHA